MLFQDKLFLLGCQKRSIALLIQHPFLLAPVSGTVRR
ncbi:hypothetical protein RLDS_12465 [Sphingobium lactosutens DS20]|uniref:Uncharacterized protein n=1 Tax=Sphingobium lactosutens DS20 TaxID=1331060 RepID=T0HPL4_9SPHN|nr:hypothetical protein RLDS_12465 [Sphingobium lactosutens DS20]